jgi:exodeoxyribonuclease-1
MLLARHPQPGSALVYDLRHDPTPFLEMSVEQLVEAWKFTRDPDVLRLPVKTVKYNRSPAVAPLGVMKDAATQERLGLSLKTIAKHRAILQKRQTEFADKVLQAVARLDAAREKEQATLIDNQLTVDARLYEGFINNADKAVMPEVRTAQPEALGRLAEKFRDDRLKSLLPLYKARNYPASLDSEERAQWDNFCRQQLFEGGSDSRLAKYFARLAELAEGKLTDQQKYLLEELQLYGQSIVPSDADADAVG